MSSQTRADDHSWAIDDIDHRRFNIGPADEVVLTWWDHKVTFSVLREHSGHQVIVQEDVDVDWSWHIGISVASACLSVIIAMIAGLPIGYSLLLGLLLGLIIIGLILFEKKQSADSLDALYRSSAKIDGQVALLIDEPIWEDIKSAGHKVYQMGEEASDYDRGNKLFNAIFDQLAKIRPMTSSAMTSVLNEMHQQLDAQRLDYYHNTIHSQYEKNPDMALRLGYGVRACTCQACQAIRDHANSWDTSGLESGAIAATARKPQRIKIGTTAYVDTAVGYVAMRKKAKARVEAYERKRQAQIAKAKEDERKRIAREYVSSVMDKRAMSKEDSHKAAKVVHLRATKKKNT